GPPIVVSGGGTWGSEPAEDTDKDTFLSWEGPCNSKERQPPAPAKDQSGLSMEAHAATSQPSVTIIILFIVLLPSFAACRRQSNAGAYLPLQHNRRSLLGVAGFEPALHHCSCCGYDGAGKEIAIAADDLLPPAP
ncbi:MAG: hypothetical protein ABIH90_02135, partial [Candidatus Aenigmatarchaeota archaeon]